MTGCNKHKRKFLNKDFKLNKIFKNKKHLVILQISRKVQGLQYNKNIIMHRFQKGKNIIRKKNNIEISKNNYVKRKIDKLIKLE